MALGDIAGMMEEKNAGAVRVPDLDWLMLSEENTKNIPTPHNVEIIPQLQETWGNTDASSARLISNQVKSESLPSQKIASEDISGVVNTAKKEMMLGLSGKGLSKKLASIYPKNLLVAAKKELTKLAQEQGLLGGVYVDLTPFDSCDHAAKVLGRNKIRLAKYVVGEPKRCVCSSHHQGYCKALGKNVIDEVDYNSKLLSDYTTHLHVAGILGRGEVLSSKENLRGALLKSAAIREPEAHEVPTVEKERPMDIEASFGDLQETLLKEAKSEVKSVSEFDQVRPVLAFIQNEMLKGKMGSDLKEAISQSIAQPTIEKFASQIKKAVSLQGLLGNVYVDISYYNNFDDAVKAIKTASTSPSYVVHTEPRDDLDDLLERVAAVTGCEVLPRDGKIKAKVASSYIDDLQFSSRVSSDMAEQARNRIEAGDNVLGVLRDIYISSLSYTPTAKEGGQPGRFHQNVSHKYANREKLKSAAYKAVEAGFPIEKIENKLMGEIPAAEAVGMVRKVIASVREVDANVLTNCTTEKYQFSHDAILKKASKCSDCVRFTCAGCTALGLRFAASKNEELPAIDPKTEKVLFEENPDVLRDNLNKEFDMPDYSGANINVDLDKMRSSEASKNVDVDTTFNMEGMDAAMRDM